jgi:hypothetical protein
MPSSFRTPTQQLHGDNGGHFVIVNEAAGKTEDIALEI